MLSSGSGLAATKTTTSSCRSELSTTPSDIRGRLTTRWSRPGQPGRLRLCDTRPWLAGRLISRPLGVRRVARDAQRAPTTTLSLCGGTHNDEGLS